MHTVVLGTDETGRSAPHHINRLVPERDERARREGVGGSLAHTSNQMRRPKMAEFV